MRTRRRSYWDLKTVFFYRLVKESQSDANAITDTFKKISVVFSEACLVFQILYSACLNSTHFYVCFFSCTHNQT